MRTFGEVGCPENLWPTPELYLDRLAAYVPQLREHHRPRRYWPTRHGRSLIQSMVGAELELDIPRRAGLLEQEQRFVQYGGRSDAGSSDDGYGTTNFS
jgi:hypothetical protein